MLNALLFRQSFTSSTFAEEFPLRVAPDALLSIQKGQPLMQAARRVGRQQDQLYVRQPVPFRLLACYRIDRQYGGLARQWRYAGIFLLHGPKRELFLVDW